MNEILISPMIQNAIVLLMGGIVTGLGTLVALLLSQRRDVKNLLDICTVFSENINTLIPCVKHVIKATRSQNYAMNEVIRRDDETALQSIHTAKDEIESAEDLLNARCDANSAVAMAVGGGR